MANGHGVVSGWDTSNKRPKGVVTPTDLRNCLTPLDYMEGIRAETGAGEVTRSSSKMLLNYSAFTAVIAAAGGGWYTPRVDKGSVTLATGHSSYDRIDVVWVRQWDYETAGDHPDSEVEVGVSAGTPAASPATPAPPKDALSVFTVRVPRNAKKGTDIPVSNITRRSYVFPMGTIIPVSTTSQLDQLKRDTLVTDPGLPINVNNNGMLMSYNGISWMRIGGGVLNASWSVTNNEKRLIGSQGPLEVGRLTFTLPAQATVRVVASAQVRPVGNSAGLITIIRSSLRGSTLASRNWHSQGTSYHQWPFTEAEINLPAGSHTLILGVLTTTSSSNAVYSQPYMHATYA